MTTLRRFGSAISGTQLRNLIEGHSYPTTFDTGIELDLGAIHDAIEDLPRKSNGAIDPATDEALAPVVHAAMRDLPRKLLLDHRFWQWLACIEFREYVRSRWAPSVDFAVDATLKPGQQARFLGNAGLNGLGRNALSRLFWSAEVMGDAEEGYRLTKALYRKQDLAVGVIERSFGLIPAVARACATHLAELSENEHREALKRLNLRASTVSLEGVDEDDVRDLLLSGGHG